MKKSNTLFIVMTMSALVLAACNTASLKPDRREESRTVIKGIETTLVFIRTQQGYLATIQKHLRRCRELAVMASNGIYTAKDRQDNNIHFRTSLDEVSRNIEFALFNTMPILNSGSPYWRTTFPVVLDAGQPAVLIPRPAMDLSVFGTYSTDRNAYDRNGVPTRNPNLLHITTARKANDAITGIDRLLMKTAEYQGIAESWKKRLGYALMVQQAIAAGKPQKIREIAGRIEMDIFHLCVRSACGVWSPFDRTILNRTYTALILELKRIRTVYGVNSDIAALDPRTDNLLTVRGSDLLRLKIIKFRNSRS